MKFQLILDPASEEQITARVHRRTPLIDELERLIGSNQTVTLTAYSDNGFRILSPEQIECITVLNKKTIAVTADGEQLRLKQRLYELEAMLPPCYFRINKSALANEHALVRFQPTYQGAVDAIFKSGYREYVSRRCFAEIKRRFL